MFSEEMEERTGGDDGVTDEEGEEGEEVEGVFCCASLAVCLPEFSNHFLKSAREDNCVIGTRVFWEEADCALDAQEPVRHSPAMLAVLLARAACMDAECSEIFLEVVPVGLCKAARPIFHIEELWHVFIKQSDTFDEVAPHHHEAWFSDEVRVKTALDPPLEKFLTALWARREKILSCFLEIIIEGCNRDVLFALVVMFYRDKSDSWVFFEGGACVLEIGGVPEIVLEEELDVGGARLRSESYAEAGIPIAADAEAMWISCEGDTGICEIGFYDSADIDH